MSDPRAEEAIAFIREQIAQLETQIEGLRTSANNIARAAGLTPPYPGSRGATPTVGEMAVAKIPAPGQFAAHANLGDAIVAYFEWRGKALGAVSIDDLLIALCVGNFPGFTRDERSTEILREVLATDPRFSRLRNGYYGPAVWLKDRTKPPNE